MSSPEIAPLSEQLARGRRARKVMPRSGHGSYEPDTGRDPVGVLARQHSSRLPDLVPLRLERMLSNPFAFYRGTAAVQAADLAHEQATGANVTICGDAHLANFGVFASPHRRLVFDLNDFDEAAYGPWEWDVKRLLTSVVVAGQHRRFGGTAVRAAATRAAAAYRTALSGALEGDALTRYYAHADVESAAAGYGKATRRVIAQTVKAAAKRTSARVVGRILEPGSDGRRRIVENPPILTHLNAGEDAFARELIEQYAQSVSSDIAVLMSQFMLTDAARRVVGVGSVGTRCYIAVFTGPSGEPLILQIKEATRSASGEFGGGRAVELPPQLDRLAVRGRHGFRVVAAQRVLQAVSDPFLGYFDWSGHSYYVRQFRDRNASIDLDRIGPSAFSDYASACAAMLARAHAQSPEAAFIAGYLGGSTAFDDAVVAWAHSYATQSREDFETVRAAVSDGALG